MLFSRIYIGTSGWDYDDWIGPFYTSEKHMFSQYAEIFNTVEVNSTFYSYPSINFIKGLASVAPPGFRFSAKIPKEITHKKRLNPSLGVENNLKHFLEIMHPLKSKRVLGAFLIQLPPIAREDIPYFEDFLNMLPTEKYRFAIEFRHESWLCDKTYSLLEKYNVAFTIVDEPLLPPVVKITAGFAYIRWHGRGERPWYYYLYSRKELEEWKPRVEKIMEDVGMVFGYFNNHFRGYAPTNALQMLNLLGLINSRQRKKLKEIEYYFEKKVIELVKEKAKKFDFEKASIEDLLLLFLNKKRLERGKEIPNSQLKIYKLEEEKIEAKIKNYIVTIDLKNRKILHDCADWEKRCNSMQLCKHLAKLFLSIPENLARKILTDIATELDEWEFTTP
ncbi:MAG: hypothetical protein DRJ38_05860 [Thermoprotei archaeon]|nr:MAG: hypothetical protein DRJ38_05860 [Thermoprotei archaeon]